MDPLQPTCDDWLDRATSLEDPAEQLEAIKRAEEVAWTFAEWARLVAQASRVTGVERAMLTRLVAALLAAARRDRVVFAARLACECRVDKLGDHVGAAAALKEGESWLDDDDDDATCHRWITLARGWSRHLDDAQAARRCIGRATEHARTVRNKLAVARALATEFDERSAAAACILGAEKLNEPVSAWSIARAWFRLKRPAEAKRVLDHALSMAQTTSDALNVAGAWDAHDTAGKARAALARAGELATHTDDWIAVAGFRLAFGEDDHAVREALGRAAKQAGADPIDRERVSVAFVALLDDRDAAHRIAAPGRRPERFGTPRSPPKLGPDPSASGLFDWLRGRIREGSLTEISASSTRPGQSLATLRRVRATGLIPERLRWLSRDALQDVCWTAGVLVDHHARALAALLLAIHFAEQDLVETLSYLVESCRVLGPQALDECDRFLAWLWACTTDDEGNPAFAVVLGTALLLVAVDPEGARAHALVETLATHPERAAGRWQEETAQHWKAAAEHAARGRTGPLARALVAAIRHRNASQHSQI